MTKLMLTSVSAPVTYAFRGDAFGWANCTINDSTGELSIQSDRGSWTHRWDARPSNLGAPTLTAFIARGSVDYLARKLQREGRDGRRFSAEATCVALRRRLCEQRLEDGRSQLEYRLEPDDMVDGEPLPHLLGRYTESGLPIFSGRIVDAPSWNDPNRTEQLPYLSREVARRIWSELGELSDAVCRSSDLFYERVTKIDGFSDYVTGEPWDYLVTEQTPEDRALREIVLPALIEACRANLTSDVAQVTAV